MKQYRVLTLTDHTRHSKENSIYALLSEMLEHPKCLAIDVASRGLKENVGFFEEGNLDTIAVSRINPDFSYTTGGMCFSQDLRFATLSDYDLVFLRLPRPVSDEFLLKLKASLPQTIFVNDPEGIVICGTKAYLLNFPEYCPPMQLCKSSEDVLNFASQYDMVLRPLKEYGGKGLIKIVNGVVNDGMNDYPITTYLATIEPQLTADGYLAMEYMHNVGNGDKRLIVVDGKILAASLRLPAAGSWLCNVALGGISTNAIASQEEEELVAAIYPALKAAGILICGLDTLENANGLRILSEINVLSIGGFPQAQAQTGRLIIKETIDNIFEYADDRSK